MLFVPVAELRFARDPIVATLCDIDGAEKAEDVGGGIEVAEDHLAVGEAEMTKVNALTQNANTKKQVMSARPVRAIFILRQSNIAQRRGRFSPVPGVREFCWRGISV